MNDTVETMNNSAQILGFSHDTQYIMQSNNINDDLKFNLQRSTIEEVQELKKEQQEEERYTNPTSRRDFYILQSKNESFKKTLRENSP